MDTEEKLVFAELLGAYKHLWLRYQKEKYLLAKPDADPELVHEMFFERTEQQFQDLDDSLVEDRALHVHLRTLVRSIDANSE